MATDIPGLKAKLLVERQVLLDMVALIDIVAEQAAIDAAAATYQQKARRWTLIRDKIDRLQVVEDQIAALTP
jgi:hypothetical protein